MSKQLTLTKRPSVRVQMLIRKSPHEVFEAFADPAITTRFWFTKSSGRLELEASVTWTWEMYDLSTHVAVTDFEQDKRLAIKWNDDKPTTVEWKFEPKAQGTFVTITESGFQGDGDEVVAQALGSTGGFSMVLAAAKALLEHDIELNLVKDHIAES